MDLSKFTSMLQRRAITFVRADSLGDPFEGTVSQLDAGYFEHVIARRADDSAFDPYPGESDEMLRHTAIAFARARMTGRKAHHITCWHMNDRESVAMWKLYSASSDSICIRTSYRTLADVLPDNAFLGMVRYLDFDTAAVWNGCTFDPIMAKRLSYGHEHEVRAVIDDADFWSAKDAPEPPVAKHIPVDITRLIRCVYVNPDAPEWFRDVVVGLCQQYKLDADIQYSDIARDLFY